MKHYSFWPDFWRWWFCPFPVWWWYVHFPWGLDIFWSLRQSNPPKFGGICYFPWGLESNPPNCVPSKFGLKYSNGRPWLHDRFDVETLWFRWGVGWGVWLDWLVNIWRFRDLNQIRIIDKNMSNICVPSWCRNENLQNPWCISKNS